MKYAHLATRVYDQPLLITPEKAAIIEEVFRSRIEGRAALESPPAQASRADALAAELAAQGMQRADGGYWRTTDGIALIPVVGTLVQRGDSIDAMSGLLGYNRIAAQLQAALDDPRVDAILLEFDTPGGEASGVMDLAAKIAAAAQRKPTWAHANEQAFSAGTWLATAAGRVYAPVSGMVGSIGVVMLHRDESVKDQKAGITYTPIYAGARKVDFSSHAPLSDTARSIAQERVDELYDLFVAAVANHRSLEEQAVRDTEAGLLSATAALDFGLIDGVASFDETLAALGAEAQQYRMRGRTMPRAAGSITSIGADTMTEQERAAHAAAIAEARNAALAEGEAKGKAAAEAKAKADAEKAAAEANDAARAAAKTAQERVLAITGHEEAKGREELAKSLAATDMPAEQAIALLKAAPKASSLGARMPKNPAVGADAPPEDRPQGSVLNLAPYLDSRYRQKSA